MLRGLNGSSRPPDEHLPHPNGCHFFRGPGPWNPGTIRGMLLPDGPDPMRPYYYAMWAAFALLSGYVIFRPKRRYPAKDHSWVRYKPGTWIKRRIAIDWNSVRSEETRLLRLHSITGHQYVLEEIRTTEGKEPQTILHSREQAITVEDAPVRLPGRVLDCTVWLEHLRSQERTTTLQLFIPKGQDEPVGITFKDWTSSGKLMAAGDKEPIQVVGRTHLCTRLEGEVRFGEATGTMTVWHCRDVPGSEVRSRLVLKGKEGTLVNDCALVEIHEER